jgi:ribosomal protein S1
MNQQDWETIQSKYPIGQLIQGTVVQHMPFGVFIDIGESGVLGLVRIVDFLDEGRMTPDRYPEVGKRVAAIVYEYGRVEDPQIHLNAKPSALHEFLVPLRGEHFTSTV